MSLLLQWLDTEQVLSFLQNEGSLDIKLHNLADLVIPPLNKCSIK